ncbi:MAG TPA: phosphonate ABC transporter ATP-binding protein [Gammaproteobacteria bacterium]|nr:MAG: phosphonate ABC transporter ATP-binding protein [Gammaproteobacteria bacterium TMED163]HAU25467.1 phosphonate ABC transporter ATP-binding protein [Gammaproteobacteria bacterium]
MSNKPELLSVESVRVQFPDGTVGLSSASFSAQQGEIIAIIGRSGAGKSTLLRCLNGFQEITSGEIYVSGESVHSMGNTELRRLRRQIGFIWQEYNIIDRLPALTNVLTARLAHNNPWQSAVGFFGSEHRKIALHNMQRLNLMHRATLRADRMSGGEKQRLSIARALTQEPDIILADEPVASLDPELAWQVLSDLSRVTREDGLLTILTLHQVHLAVEFADRILGIAEGRIVFDGPPSALDDEAQTKIYGGRLPQLHTSEENYLKAMA